jgi:hypothetical protein
MTQAGSVQRANLHCRSFSDHQSETPTVGLGTCFGKMINVSAWWSSLTYPGHRT